MIYHVIISAIDEQSKESEVNLNESQEQFNKKPETFKEAKFDL